VQSQAESSDAGQGRLRETRPIMSAAVQKVSGMQETDTHLHVAPNLGDRQGAMTPHNS